MHRHLPLGLSDVGAPQGTEKAVEPRLFADPFNEIIAVLRLVHVVVPAVRLTTPRATTILRYDNIAASREADENSNGRIRAPSIGRTRCNTRSGQLRR